jgi:hypothetical protein
MSEHAHSHAEGEGGHEELEVFPDSGITETGKPINGFLWVCYVLFLAYFHWFLSTAFWVQNERTPKWGAGWSAIEGADQWDFGGKPYGMATKTPTTSTSRTLTPRPTTSTATTAHSASGCLARSSPHQPTEFGGGSLCPTPHHDSPTSRSCSPR